jgi:outer membrane protein OmpA-like peptidoglycan-associated protein
MMIKKNSKIKLGTTGTILTIGGVVLLIIGGTLLIKRYLKKSKCEKEGGIWDKKTKTCILPEPAKNKEKKALKEAYDNLTFESGKAIIKPSSFPFLDEIAIVFADEDAKLWKLDIKGHTDNQGGLSYNQKLSEDRANAVKKYLISKGIDASKITAKGFGLSKPIAPNTTAEGRSKNRRVEFSIFKPTGEVVTTQQNTSSEQQGPIKSTSKKYKILKTNQFSEPPFKVGDIVEGTLDSNKFLLVTRDFEGNKDVQFQFGVNEFEEFKETMPSQTVIITKEKQVNLIG